MESAIRHNPEQESLLKKIIPLPNRNKDQPDILQLLQESGLLRKPKRVLVRSGHSIKLIDLNHVAYFYSRDKITYAVMPDKKRHVLELSLDQLENEVAKEQFFRINRQMIVSIEAIQEMMAYSKSRIQLKLHIPAEADVIVSKGLTPEFRKWLLGN